MKTRLTLRPGQNGTKKLVKKYGDKLVAVRYLYDEASHQRYKTVELIEEVLPWDPPIPSRNPQERVRIRIGYEEVALRETVKDAGAIWHQKDKLWELDYAQVSALGLASRITEK